jgi:serine/threonine protein kinase
MSPELLGAKALHRAQALYDGTKADIWAAGVMLCVMLIGRFPFEGIEMSNATNLEEVSEHVSTAWACFSLGLLLKGFDLYLDVSAAW